MDAAPPSQARAINRAAFFRRRRAFQRPMVVRRCAVGRAGTGRLLPGRCPGSGKDNDCRAVRRTRRAQAAPRIAVCCWNRSPAGRTAVIHGGAVLPMPASARPLALSADPSHFVSYRAAPWTKAIVPPPPARAEFSVPALYAVWRCSQNTMRSRLYPCRLAESPGREAPRRRFLRGSADGNAATKRPGIT